MSTDDARIIRKRKTQLYMAFMHKRFRLARAVHKQDEQRLLAPPSFVMKAVPVAVGVLTADVCALTNAGDKKDVQVTSDLTTSDLTTSDPMAAPSVEPEPAPVEPEPAPVEPEAAACSVQRPVLPARAGLHRRGNAGQKYPAKTVNKVPQSTPVRDRCPAARTSADAAVDSVVIRNLLLNMSSAMSREVEKQNAYVMEAQKRMSEEQRDETVCDIALGFFNELNNELHNELNASDMPEILSDLEL